MTPPPLPTSESHVYLRPRCGICGVILKIGERFVAITGNADSSTLLHCTQPSFFSNDGQGVGKIFLCLPRRCRYCDPSIEGVPIHSDCLELFLRECQRHDAWNRLWILAAWQTPWKGRMPRQLNLEPKYLQISSFAAAEALVFLKLNLLPSEIIQAIQSYSPDSPLWRLCTALGLAVLASQDDLNRFTTIRLPRIVSWARGSKPETTGRLPQHPIVRLTLDAFGIQRIERLSEYSDRISEKPSPDSRVFAFIDERFVDRRIGVLTIRVFNTVEEAKISNAVVHFQLGRARLQFQHKLHGPWIWNTPSPAIRTISTQSQDPKPVVTVYRITSKTPRSDPTLLQAFGSTYDRLSEAELTSLYPSDYRLHMYTIMGDKWTAQFRTVSLSHTTGLTFFYKPGKVYTIHSHTATEPSALRTFERLPREIQQEILWVYVPVPPGDHILAMGQGDRGAIIMDCTFVIRMKLAGDIIIGPIQFHYSNSYSFLDSPPVALVLSEGSIGSVSSFGVMIRNGSNADKFVSLPKPRRRIRDRHLNCLQSVAPLEDVIQVQAFLSQKHGLCIGLLMCYENGAQRTLGQCRIGVDPVETYRQLTQICFKSLAFTDPESEVTKEIAAVECTGEQAHSHIDDGWKCCPLKGSLEVWFNDEEFRVAYVETPAP